MMMNFATNLLGFSREQYVAGSILFVSYESSLFLREDTVKKEEGKQKSWNTLSRVANANCRGPLTAGSKSLTALVCLSQTTNLQVVRVRGTSARVERGAKTNPVTKWTLSKFALMDLSFSFSLPSPSIVEIVARSKNLAFLHDGWSLSWTNFLFRGKKNKKKIYYRNAFHTMRRGIFNFQGKYFTRIHEECEVKSVEVPLRKRTFYKALTPTPDAAIFRKNP